VSLQPGASGPDMAAMGFKKLIQRATAADELIAALGAPLPDLTELRAVLKDSCARLERTLLTAAHD